MLSVLNSLPQYRNTELQASGLPLAQKVSLISAQALILAAGKAKSRLETFLTLLIGEKSAAYTLICTPQIMHTTTFSVTQSELK